MGATSLGPSPHLSWAELACRDGTPYPPEWRTTRAVALAHEFERIRTRVGAPIAIGSAYRTPAYNRRIGGAVHSQHCQGRALDLYPPVGWTVGAFATVIRAVIADERCVIFGLGRYPTFVHIDIRPMPAHGQLVVWTGRRTWAEGKADVRAILDDVAATSTSPDPADP